MKCCRCDLHSSPPLQASPIITDGILESLASDLINLEHFHIAGCPKVTERGIWAVVSNNVKGVVGLGLEGLSQRFVCW